MKKYGFFLSFMFMSTLVFGQQNAYDPMAILMLDKMSSVISSLTSVSFDVETAYDQHTYPHGIVKKFKQSEVHMAGPDKMIINSYSDRGHRQLWYNGEQFGFFDYTEKNYGLVEAPGTIIHMIDSIHAHYDVDFPAGDLFYPAFTDDLIESCQSISFLGKAKISDQDCFSVLAVSEELRIQIWISNDSYNLPLKYLIVHLDENVPMQYVVTFSNWVLNPDLPVGMFDFSPPPGAHEVTLFSTSDK